MSSETVNDAQPVKRKRSGGGRAFHSRLEPFVDFIRELAGQGLGSKRIARQLGISRNSVRRYLAGATVGFQQRPAARCLDAAVLDVEVDGAVRSEVQRAEAAGVGANRGGGERVAL